MKRRNRKKIVWENWNKVSSRSSPRVRDQELIRQFKRRTFMSNDSKPSRNQLKIEPFKPSVHSSEESAKENTEEVINILNHDKLSKYCESHSITNLSPRSLIDRIRIPKTKPSNSKNNTSSKSKSKSKRKTEFENLIMRLSHLPVESFVKMKVSIFDKKPPKNSKSITHFVQQKRKTRQEFYGHFPKFPINQRSVSAQRSRFLK